MMKILSRSASMVCASLLFISSASAAITVVNEDPSICEIQVVVGANAPEGRVQNLGQLEADERRSFDASKLCVRRTLGDSCEPAYSDWKCCEAEEGADALCLVP